MAHRTATHESTRFSPYFLLFHREAHLPTDIALRPSNKQKSSDEIFKSIDKTFRQVQHNIKQAQQRQQRSYNQKRKPHNYSSGDIIWLFNPVTKEGLCKKFMFCWVGPYKIKHIYGNDTLEIESTSGPVSVQRVHVSRTKPCYQKESHQPQREYEYEYNIAQNEYKIDQIIDKTIIKEEEHYLVHWKGYSNRYNMWIPASEINAKELIQKKQSN